MTAIDTALMETPSIRMRFECSCGAVIEDDDGPPIVEAVERHTSEVHGHTLDRERIESMIRPV